MNLIQKIYLKLKIESTFLLEQKLGWRKPKDQINIPKYLLKKYLTDNAVIIDCGAHIGADSVELARVFLNCKVHSFEPIPSIYNNLVHLTRKYINIECHPIALSNQNGVAKFYVSSGESDASSSLLKPTGHIENHKEVLFDEEIQVPTITLDDWAIKNNVTKVDFLWLDMQGFELQMLKASTTILNTVKAIHTEVSIKNSYESAVLYPEYKKWLEGKGFKAIIEAIPSGTDMGNVFFGRE
jgi:2-O-methyltransferase